MYNREKIINVMYDIKNEGLSVDPYVVIAQPRRLKEEIPAQNFNNDDGHKVLHLDLHGFSHGFIDIFGEKVDVARNYLIERVIDSGAKYLFFIGEDTVVPYNAFKVLHKTAMDNPGNIITGVYYIKLSEPMVGVKNNNWITVPNVDPGQIIDSWQTGMDCMLIPVDILKKMKEQEPDLPFCCIAKDIPDLPFVGEDNFFAHRVRKMGIKVLVNTDVQCLHIDLASGKYTAHPDVKLTNYFTNIPITVPLTMDDKEYIDRRWLDRVPKQNRNNLNDLIEQYESKSKLIKLNLGCGNEVLDGYIGIDKYSDHADVKVDVFDITWPQDKIDEIYASHFLEHLHHIEGVELLKTLYLSLKVNGKLIMEMPDLEATCKEFIKASDEERYILTVTIFGTISRYVGPNAVADGTASPHLWGYYPKILSDILTQIGFKNVEILPQQGLHPGKNFRIEATK